MKAKARPFAREYKSRAIKATFQLQDGASTSEKTFPSNRSANHDIGGIHAALRRNEAIRQDAELIFRQDGPAPSKDNFDGKAQPPIETRGRVFPCLLQDSPSASPESQEKPRSAISGQRSLRSSTRLKRRTTPPLEPISGAKSSANPFIFQGSPPNHDFLELTDLEIQSLIARAEAELMLRRQVNHDRLRGEIEAKLERAGMSLSDLFENPR